MQLTPTQPPQPSEMTRTPLYLFQDLEKDPNPKATLADLLSVVDPGDETLGLRVNGQGGLKPQAIEAFLLVLEALQRPPPYASDSHYCHLVLREIFGSRSYAERYAHLAAAVYRTFRVLQRRRWSAVPTVASSHQLAATIGLELEPANQPTLEERTCPTDNLGVIMAFLKAHKQLLFALEAMEDALPLGYEVNLHVNYGLRNAEHARFVHQNRKLRQLVAFLDLLDVPFSRMEYRCRQSLFGESRSGYRNVQMSATELPGRALFVDCARLQSRLGCVFSRLSLGYHAGKYRYVCAVLAARDQAEVERTAPALRRLLVDHLRLLVPLRGGDFCLNERTFQDLTVAPCVTSLSQVYPNLITWAMHDIFRTYPARAAQRRRVDAPRRAP